MSEPSSEKCRTALDDTESAFEHPSRTHVVQVLPTCLGPVLRSHHAWLWLLHFYRLSSATFHHNVDIQRLAAHSAHISGDRSVPDPFLCSPAEMDSPSGAWETLVVNPFRQVLSGFNAQTAPRPRHHGLKHLRHRHSKVATCQPCFSTISTLHNLDRPLQLPTSMERSTQTTVDDGVIGIWSCDLLTGPTRDMTERMNSSATKTCLC